jgi:tRNA pseudouridine55 synthase
LDETRIRTALCSFIGESMQRPPKYAAIKVQGKKLYEYARAEQEMPDIPLRQIHIDQISDISMNHVGEDEVDIHFTTQVSKGTYIRSLARDVGEKLGIVGTLKDLRRTASGMFRLDEAITLAEVMPSTPLIDPLPYLGYSLCRLADSWLKKVENGAFLPMSLFSDSANTIIYNALDEPLAIYRYDKERDCMRMSVKLQ